MNWAEISPKLVAILTTIAGEDRPGLKVEHADRPRKMMSVQAGQTLTIQVISAVPQTRAEIVRELDEATNKLVETTYNNFRVTLQCSCDSLRNTDTAWAWGTIMKLNERITRPRILRELRSVGVGLARRLGARESNPTIEGRVHSRALCEFALNVRTSDTDPVMGDWIEHAVLNTDIKDSSGDSLPAELQAVDVVVNP